MNTKEYGYPELVRNIWNRPVKRASIIYYRYLVVSLKLTLEFPSGSNIDGPGHKILELTLF